MDAMMLPPLSATRKREWFLPLPYPPDVLQPAGRLDEESRVAGLQQGQQFLFDHLCGRQTAARVGNQNFLRFHQGGCFLLGHKLLVSGMMGREARRPGGIRL